MLVSGCILLLWSLVGSCSYKLLDALQLAFGVVVVRSQLNVVAGTGLSLVLHG